MHIWCDVSSHQATELNCIYIYIYICKVIHQINNLNVLFTCRENQKSKFIHIVKTHLSEPRANLNIYVNTLIFYVSVNCMAFSFIRMDMYPMGMCIWVIIEITIIYFKIISGASFVFYTLCPMRPSERFLIFIQKMVCASTHISSSINVENSNGKYSYIAKAYLHAHNEKWFTFSMTCLPACMYNVYTYSCVNRSISPDGFITKHAIESSEIMCSPDYYLR